MEEGRGTSSGRLVVALPASVGLTLTAPLVRAFRERFPNATLCVLEGLSTYVLEWLTIGRVDCAVVYTVPTSSAVELVPVLNEQLYLVSSRATAKPSPDELIGDEITLADVAKRHLVMPSRPHSIRMLLEGAMAQSSLKSQITLEIESIPAILTLVREEGMDAVLSLKAVRSSGREDDFSVRPIREPTLETTLWIATSAQRPCGPLLSQAMPLLQTLLRDHWATPGRETG